jgi:Lipopolysaccharide-assembly
MRILAAITTSTLLLTGCAHYQVGSESLYAPDIATVYVPMIESDSFRPDLGERLTEAVIKEIELKTPYKVVGTPDADSILAVKLSGDSRHLLGENSFDDPRLSESAVYTQVSWLNRRRLPMCPPESIALPPELLDIDQTANLVPEAGQSVASSQQQAIERLAQQIVGTMEAPW